MSEQRRHEGQAPGNPGRPKASGKRALRKDIFREIWNTKARFLSIFAIIMLGVAFFTGIKATGPNMLDTAAGYYDDYRLMDLKALSTYGLDDAAIEELRSLPGVQKVQPGYSAEAFLGDSGLIAKVFSYGPDNELNGYAVQEGRLPERAGEIALDDALIRQGGFELGGSLRLNGEGKEDNLEDTLATREFTIVGFVRSPQFIESSNRGMSQIGKGTADAFAVIAEEDFTLPVYTEAYVTFEDARAEAAYTPAYEDLIEAHAEAAEQALAGLPDRRLAEAREEGEEKLTEGETEIADAEAKLADAEAELLDAARQLNEGRREYEDGAAKLAEELGKAEAELQDGEAELEAGRRELAQGKRELAQGEAQLNAGAAQLERQRGEAEARLSEGEQLAASLAAALQQEPGALPEAQRSQLSAAAAAADTRLGEAVAGYFAGVVPRETAQLAVAGFGEALQAGAAELEAAQRELDSRRAELERGRRELAAAEARLAQGEAELAEGREQLAQAREEGEAELAVAKEELDQGQLDYEEGRLTFETEKADAERELADAREQLAEGREELASLEVPKVYVLDRTSNPGYAEYRDNADRLSAIASAFPVFFFLIAALVSLTTMTRMVEEQRLQIGTMKALGYSSGNIMAKFLVYGSLASVAASIAGLAVGFTMFPTVIYNAYGALYNLPPIHKSFYLSYASVSLAVAIICTTMTAMIAARVELRSNASALMRPKAPKSGQRIVLERITPLWRRLSFAQKVTARNLFRYKQRMFMTVIGVAGCTALILTGFGLKDSIGSIAPRQFGEIMKYDALVALNEDATPDDREELDALVGGDSAIDSALDVAMISMSVQEQGINNQEVRVFVPEGLSATGAAGEEGTAAAGGLDRFVTLRDRTSGEAVPLPEDGAVITEKLSVLYDLEIGDTFTVVDSDNDPFEVTIAGITENYVLHYIYMTPGYYSNVFGEEASANTRLINYSEEGRADAGLEDRLGEQLTGNPAVAAVSFSSGVGMAFTDTMQSMDVVMLVLIVSAAALAFVVLYNLTNINVSERIRELSTIKVLGFYDNEVTMYIFREIILLTLLGILGGSGLGIILHGFVLQTAELDATMFAPVINWPSYLYSGLLTLLFSGAVMLFMHIKLKRVDMIEALKSVE